MSKIKPGLGRGLEALIHFKPQGVDNNESKSVEDNNTSVTIGTIIRIPVDKIVPNEFQPRIEFKQEPLDELKKSILENGLIQPITVRIKNNELYELISGERRLRACKDIGYKDIPAYIIQVDTIEAMLALSLIENIQREDLNAIEVAKAYKRLMDECNLSQEDIAERVGKNRSTITNSVRLLKLPVDIQNALINDDISAGHARALINISNEKMQLDILKKIVKNKLSVRKVESIVKELLNKFTETPKPKKIINNLDTSLLSLEDKLRKLFGTKVLVKYKKDSAGEIVIEYYSQDELDRILELFDTISE